MKEVSAIVPRRAARRLKGTALIANRSCKLRCPRVQQLLFRVP